MKPTELINLFQRSRKNNTYAVIEGVQALKHAVRFQAEIEHIITYDIKYLKSLLDELAKDVVDFVISHTQEVDETIFTQLSPQPPRTKVIALAKRRNYILQDMTPAKPIVLLEEPRDLENIGAVIRVAAAANIAGVCILGTTNPWHPASIRGAAGLQYAIPVVSIADISELKDTKRPLIALDPQGENIQNTVIAPRSVLIFGTERNGVSAALLAQSDQTVSLPMQAGVSSLNLATSVAATLYRM